MEGEPNKKQMTITFNREKVMNAVVVIELVLLVVFGVQLYGLKQQINGGAKAAPSPSAAPAQAPAAQAATGPVDIKVTDSDHVLGKSDAPVTIVEYSDFECPFCERAFPTVQQIMDTYKDKVRLVYRQFPLSFHPQAQKAAEASECASDQGKFWEFHDKVFTNQSLLSGGVPQLKKWAGELGLNQSKFDNCLDSGDKAAMVAASESQGQQYGVTGTPSFFIDGTSVVGAQPFSAFQQIIDAELAKN